MPESHKIRDIAKDRGETEEQIIGALMRELGTPYKVAVELGLYANAVRNWLLKHGWIFRDGEWHEPEVTGVRR
jgi:hypothetical protein